VLTDPQIDDAVAFVLLCLIDNVQRFLDAVIMQSTDPSDNCPGDYSNNDIVDPADLDDMVNALLGL